VLAVVLAFGVPALARQLANLADRAPELGANASQIVVQLQAQLEGAGLPVDLETLYGTLPGRLGELTGAFAADALSLVAATGVLLFSVGLVLILAFFMLVDGDRLWERFTGLLSPELRSEAELFRQSADRSFGGFIRASLLLGLIYGVGMLLILAPLGVPFAGLLALVSGLFMIIPFFGPFIAVIPVFVATILGAADRFLPVFLLTMALQQLILSVIGPRLMANVIGIHPLFVFLALLIGARIAGFWGVLLAMPLAGIANTFARYIYQVTQGRRTRAEADQLIVSREPAPAPATEITVARQ
jgi:predicted PurR-regulated permease PerM